MLLTRVHETAIADNIPTAETAKYLMPQRKRLLRLIVGSGLVLIAPSTTVATGLQDWSGRTGGESGGGATLS
jgi:hypothetical protein